MKISEIHFFKRMFYRLRSSMEAFRVPCILFKAKSNKLCLMTIYYPLSFSEQFLEPT